MKISFKVLTGALLAGMIAWPAAAEASSSHNTVNKSIRIKDNSEAGSVDSVNGSIRIGANSVVRSADSVNGGIDIDDGTIIGSVESVNGRISLGAEVTVEDDVDSVNGTISMEKGGQVGGDIGTVNGAVRLEGTRVAGGIKTINGSISLLEGTEVVGNILVKEPRGWNMNKRRKPVEVIIGEDVVVHGNLVFEHAVSLDLHPSAKVGEIIGDDVKMVGESRMY